MKAKVTYKQNGIVKQAIVDYPLQDFYANENNVIIIERELVNVKDIIKYENI